MMMKMMAALLLVLMLLGCISCEDDMGGELEIPGMVDEDGHWYRIFGKKLHRTDTYVSDGLAIRCSSKLSTSVPFTDLWTSISPDTLVIRSGDLLCLHPASETIYFCANKDLYSCNYQGGKLTNHTMDIDYTFIRPILSSDARYITMLSLSSVNYGGKLNRLDLQTGEFVHLEQTGIAAWAAYNAAQDRFYYFSQSAALSSIGIDGSDPATHFAGFEEAVVFCQSDGSQYIGAYSNDPWKTHQGVIFDIAHGEIFQIENMGRMTLNPRKNELTYSVNYGDRCELWRKDLELGTQLRIHSGRLSNSHLISGYNNFLYRQDGESLYFTAIKK